MSAIRPGHAGCHCCTDEAASVPAEFHRDLTTGAVPDSPNEYIDAIEELWRCDDGDISGLTQEQVFLNCSGTMSVETSAANSLDATPGSLRFRFQNITPDSGVDNFRAIQIVWTGTTFDAFSHVAHMAGGSLSAYAAGRQISFRESPVAERSGFPIPQDTSSQMRWGIVSRKNGLLWLWSDWLQDMAAGGGNETCWHPQLTTGLKVIDADGNYRAATTAEMRAAGLTVDAIATQTTHDVGLFVMMYHEPEVSQYTGLTISPPIADVASATIGLDTIGIYATYRLACTAAFVNISTLTASMPDHTGQSNVEPYELRGMSCNLSLETAPVWDVNLHSPILQGVYDAPVGSLISGGCGYFYRGTTTATTYRAGQGGTSETATVEIWYAPCLQLVCRLTVASVAYDAWFSIDHSDEYSSDPCDGAGDRAGGHATAPTFAGLFQRDIRLPCQSAGIGERLSVPWYGSDCVDRENETSWVSIHGIVGKCQQPMPGEPDPVCTTGLNPNQLPQLTDCYSLDPIAIGYRRRITNVFGLGGFGPCGSTAAPLEKSYPNNVERHTASLTNPFSVTAGSAEIFLTLPGHGFSQTIPGSSGVVIVGDTRTALLDFIQNSGLWPAIPTGFGISIDLTFDWVDANTLSVFVSIGQIGWAATSSGSGGGSFDFIGQQAWGHNCQLAVLHSLGFVGFSLDTVIGVGSQLVAGHLYVDITE